jgi:hypothetical protein
MRRRRSPDAQRENAGPCDGEASASWLGRQNPAKSLKLMVGATGIEPVTPTMSR